MVVVQPRRPEEVIGEWGVRDVTPRSQAERRRLEADRDVNPLTGKPLRRRMRNFTPQPDTYLASLGGPLPYMQRLRQIDDLAAHHLDRVAAVYAAHGADAQGWRDVAERWDFGDVNDLIDRHNRWYPAESRLPNRLRGPRDFVKVGGRPYRREPLDARWILERFPARP